MKFIKRLEHILTKMMNKTAEFAGKPMVFVVSILLIVGWFLVSGLLEYDTWFDIMDVTIFITTFLMLFVVQASQNADTKAIQDKLDEIIDVLPGASKSKEGEEERFKEGREQTAKSKSKN
ncbi:hypothetical protein B7Y94_00935 [Candidatus Saccharibacteria bacterium 32-49-12]|nr:MAG: hypothetical protein B7Y94_00935 [Candidatus Saccharibacteria bacterium 32-49-12]